MIEKYFDKYGDSIISFNFIKKIKTIHFWIKNSWDVPDNLLPNTMNIQHNRTEVDKDDNSRYYCILYILTPDATDDKSLVTTKIPTWDDMYMVIESVFEFNLDKERKDELLKERISELQDRFSKLTLEELASMKFS